MEISVTSTGPLPMRHPQHTAIVITLACQPACRYEKYCHSRKWLSIFPKCKHLHTHDQDALLGMCLEKCASILTLVTICDCQKLDTKSVSRSKYTVTHSCRRIVLSSNYKMTGRFYHSSQGRKKRQSRWPWTSDPPAFTSKFWRIDVCHHIVLCCAGDQPWALSILGKHSTHWATASA